MDPNIFECSFEGNKAHVIMQSTTLNNLLLMTSPKQI